MSIFPFLRKLWKFEIWPEVSKVNNIEKLDYTLYANIYSQFQVI